MKALLPVARSTLAGRPHVGGVPGMSPTLILRASCKGIIRELSYAAAKTPALAGLPEDLSVVFTVKSRKQAELIYLVSQFVVSACLTSASPTLTAECLQVKMNRGILFLSLLGFLPFVIPACPPPCKCATNIIDCMSKGLTVTKLPAAFRPSAEIINLSYNRLTSIPSGLFDNLKSLQTVHLQGNPWECNCDILYLRSWLQWQQNRTFYRDVRCASPAHLQGRVVAYLTEDEIISTCQYWYCTLALFSQLVLIILLFLQAILVIFIIVYLRRFRRMTAEARSTTRDLQQHADTWSLQEQ